jgi:hypothetical protein
MLRVRKIDLCLGLSGATHHHGRSQGILCVLSVRALWKYSSNRLYYLISGVGSVPSAVASFPQVDCTVFPSPRWGDCSVTIQSTRTHHALLNCTYVVLHQNLLSQKIQPTWILYFPTQLHHHKVSNGFH